MFEREVRDFSTIKRWTTFRAVHRHSLAEHSFYVALYADQIATFIQSKCDRSILLRYCLWHDVEELLSGDLPGPYKRAVGNAEKAREFEMMHNMSRFTGAEWQVPKDDEIIAIVKLANAIDEVMYLATEHQMGNGNVPKLLEQSFNRAVRAIRRLKLEEEKEFNLLEIFHAAMTEHKIGTNKYLRD